MTKLDRSAAATPKKTKKATKGDNKSSVKLFHVNQQSSSLRETNEAAALQLSAEKSKRKLVNSPSGFLMFNKIRSPVISNRPLAQSSSSSSSMQRPLNMLTQLQLYQQKSLKAEADQRQSTQEIILEKIKLLFQKYQAKVNREIVLGFNQIQKEVAGNQLSMVVINKSAKKELVELLMEVCLNKRVPFLVIPNLFDELAAVFQVRSANCFAIRRNPPQGMDTDQSLLDGRSAVLDDLRDFLVRQSRKSVEFL